MLSATTYPFIPNWVFSDSQGHHRRNPEIVVVVDAQTLTSSIFGSFSSSLLSIALLNKITVRCISIGA